jgi:hypothetical protein
MRLDDDSRVDDRNFEDSLMACLSGIRTARSGIVRIRRHSEINVVGEPVAFEGIA